MHIMLDSFSRPDRPTWRRPGIADAANVNSWFAHEDLRAPGAIPNAELWTIVGIGNVFRGDDAVGLHLVRYLKHRLDPAVTVTALHDTVTPLLDLFAPDRHILIVDAVRGLSVPGSIYEIDLLRLSPDNLPRIASNHLIDLPTVIGLARTLQQLPATLTLLGIEAACVDRGAPLSKPVVQAIPAALQRVERRLGRIDGSVAG